MCGRMHTLGGQKRGTAKIEQLPKSRESRFSARCAAASLSRTCTKLCGRLLMIRCGPSHWRAWDAPAALKNIVHLPENLFRQHRSMAAVATTLASRPRIAADLLHSLNQRGGPRSAHLRRMRASSIPMSNASALLWTWEQTSRSLISPFSLAFCHVPSPHQGSLPPHD